MGYLTLKKLYTDIKKLEKTHPECLDMKILFPQNWVVGLLI